MKANKINHWPTPPESPDLNPIERIWAAMKYCIRRRVKPTNNHCFREISIPFYTFIHLIKTEGRGNGKVQQNRGNYQRARVVEAAGACVSQPDSWRCPAEVTPDRRAGTFPPGVHRWCDQAVASTYSSLHSSTRRTFWKQTLVMFDICADVHFDSHICAVAYSGHFCFRVTTLCQQ